MVEVEEWVLGIWYWILGIGYESIDAEIAAFLTPLTTDY